MINLKNIITEVRVINPNRIQDEPPLRDTETIRVYHGFAEIIDAIVVALRGMSGKERAGRRYSPEAVNNPKGLFVTIDLNTAKEFSCPGVIIEFDSKVGDLEAPVWHGGRSYFVQGEKTTGFSDRGGAEREIQRLANRERAMKSKSPQISNSDRPELAELIFTDYENQSLFVGDLNPNMIRQYWVSENAIKRRESGPYVRMSRKEFLKVYGVPYIEELRREHAAREKNMGGHTYSHECSKLDSERLLNPADNYDRNTAITNIKKKYKGCDFNVDQIFDTWVKDAQEGNTTAIRQMINWFWPKQIKQMGIDV